MNKFDLRKFLTENKLTNTSNQLNEQLDEDMIFAISVAFDELANSGEWTRHLERDEVNRVYKAIEKFDRKYRKNR